MDSSEIRLAPAIEEFLIARGISTSELLNTPIVRPAEVDDSLPITDYFISSSHNTYLLGRQLLGHASAASYTHVLTQHARCVEIDAWPSDAGLVVTHGHTLSTSTPLQSVALAIGDAVNEDSWPVLVSLECHVGVEEQKELVEVLRGAWGDKLVIGKLDGVVMMDEVGEIVKPTPRDLKGRILLMVEYYPPDDFDTVEEAEAKELAEGVQLLRLQEEGVEGPEVPGEDLPQVLVGKVERGKISEELAKLGYYARSMKPKEGWLNETLVDPPHILLNLSEPSLLSLIPTLPTLSPLISNSHKHLRRIYPAGTRINSSNVDALKFWRTGSQIVAVNWQTCDWGRQVNEGLFSGTDGWVVKPEAMRKGGVQKDDGEVRLCCEVFGASSLPAKSGSSYKAYIEAELHHEIEEECKTWKSPVLPTSPASSPDAPTAAVADLLFPPTSSSGGSYIEEGNCEFYPKFDWTFPADPLAFLRFVVKKSELGEDEEVAWACLRVNSIDVEYAAGAHSVWRLVRLQGMDGDECGATVFLRVGIERGGVR